MAPSTSTPTDLRRASVACLQCRKAKVRCLVSQRLDRCNRCITNDTGCIFAQPKRARVRSQPYPNSLRRNRRASEDDGHFFAEEAAPVPLLTDPPRFDEPARTPQTPIPTSQRATPVEPEQQSRRQTPIITNAVRARIIAALASLKGKRGAPFSFVTSDDSPSFSARSATEMQQGPEQLQASRSLKLSWLLRPLKVDSHREPSDGDQQASGSVRMPSYLSAMTLGQTIADPIEAGVINLQASRALFDFFMLQMNARWEYVLDPYYDTFESIRRRSSLLFATILFCSSKFASYSGGNTSSTPDAFLQTRLCSLARNLVIRTLAEGDRSIETMQALYFLVCWKDADDDVSYLHSGYAFRILHDLDLQEADGSRQLTRRRRTWLALFRQDRQQSLFFMRRASLSQADEEASFLDNPSTWLDTPDTLPSDLIAGCSADVRRIQFKLRGLVQKASSTMLGCLLDLLDGELNAWKSKWDHYLDRWSRMQRPEPTINPGLLHPGVPHVNTLIGLWEHSVRLNVASAILRHALLASVTFSVGTSHQIANALPDLDLQTLQQPLPPDLPGLRSSVEGAFGTLRYLTSFSTEELRCAPDAVLLLAPNAALFLCLLLCLPANGILALAFQETAVGLIRRIAQHVSQCVRSPNDTIALHSAYLNSLVELLDTPNPPQLIEPPSQHLALHMSPLPVGTQELDLDDPTLQAAQVLADGIGTQSYTMPPSEGIYSHGADPEQNLHIQGLANLLDGDLFWEMPAATADING